MVRGVTTSHEEWLARVETLAPIIEKHRDEGERERRLPEAVFEAMQSAGLFHITVPEVYGGAPVAIETAVGIVEAVSRLDGATGWNLFIGASCGTFAPCLPAPAALEVFGGGNTVIAGSFAPTGQALPVEGGYRVTGQWGFASGCHQANWWAGSCLVMEDGKPRMTDQGAPDVQLMVLPMAEAEIIDTWYTSGLRGTGSHDIKVEEVFVPEVRHFPLASVFRRPADPPAPLFAQAPLNVINLMMAAVGLGIARDAIDSFKAVVTQRTPRGGTSTLLGYHTIHEKVGRAEAMLRAARAYIYDTARQLEASPPPGEDGDESLASVRLAGAYAMETSAQVAEMMYTAGGGSAVYAKSRLERCFRDAYTATHHVLVQPLNYEMVGQYLLGMPLLMRR